jgi:predicted NBD/HSP70 family sugar kinase
MSQSAYQESIKSAPAGSRLAELQRLLESVEASSDTSRGDYNALAMLLADAALDADEDSLSIGQRMLKRVYFRQLRMPEPSTEALEQRGRVLALIDVLQWLLRRITPPAEVTSLEPAGHPRRFLEAIAVRPGLSNQNLASLLETDMTEISRVGRRLIDGGLARKRRLGRWNHWEITPRGTHVLSMQPIAPRRLDHGRIRLLAQQVIETADVRETSGPPAKWLPVAGRVFATLLASGAPLSPSELAARTRLSQRVVAAAAGFLIDAGYLTQEGRERSAEELFLPELSLPLTVNGDKYCALGIKILPKCLVGVMTDLTNLRADAGRVERRELLNSHPETVIAAVAELVKDLRQPIDGMRLPEYTIGLGIEAGGHIDSRNGKVVDSPSLKWKDVSLVERISAETGLPTVVENDVNALAVHEQLVGTAVGTDYFAAIHLNEGIGCGLILDGQLMRGRSGMAGELGHIVIDPNGRPCRCGKSGCLEALASVRAILNAIAEKHEKLPETIDEAAQLAENGDGAAIDAFTDAGDAMGRGISILQNLVNVERVLVSVPAVLDVKSRSRASKLFNGALISAVNQHAFSTAATDCTLDIRHLQKEDEYGARGAASTVVRHFVYRPLTWKPIQTVIGGEKPRSEDGTETGGVDAAVTAETTDPLSELISMMASRGPATDQTPSLAEGA